MNRRERRAMEKSIGAKRANDVSEKVAQFGKLPQKCDVCQELFDKQNKDMIQSWSVVVRQETVRIFCPDCLQKTKEIIDDYTKAEPERA